MGVGQFMAKEFIKEIGNRSREFYEFVMPPVDVYEEGSELIVVIDLAGFQKKIFILAYTRTFYPSRQKELRKD